MATLPGRRGGWRRALAVLALGLLLGGTAGLAFTAGQVLALRDAAPALTPLMRLRGRVQPLRQPFLPLSSFPQAAIDCLLAAEDPRYFEHAGLDWDSIGFALRLNASAGGFVYGGSTITQQAARTLFLTPEKTISRKLVEAVYAVEMECLLGKQRILELYLNRVEWGRNLWGLGEASRVYYGCAPRGLDIRQIAALMTVLPAPQRLRPDSFQSDPVILRRWERLAAWADAYRAVPRR